MKQRLFHFLILFSVPFAHAEPPDVFKLADKAEAVYVECIRVSYILSGENESVFKQNVDKACSKSAARVKFWAHYGSTEGEIEILISRGVESGKRDVEAQK